MNRDRQIIKIDDLWTQIYAQQIGCPCPNKRVKELFIHYVLTSLEEKGGVVGTEKLDDKFIYDQFPKFINYLAEI